jgi:hypothetical protein
MLNLTLQINTTTKANSAMICRRADKGGFVIIKDMSFSTKPTIELQ